MWTLENFVFAYGVITPIAGAGWYLGHWGLNLLLAILRGLLRERGVS